jgi:hypothetical protein
MLAITLKLLMLVGIMLLLGVIQLICFFVVWSLQLGPFKKKKSHKCSDCSKNAEYVRSTQYSGDHYFCHFCAVLEENFLKEDPNSFYWYKLDDKKDSNH